MTTVYARLFELKVKPEHLEECPPASEGFFKGTSVLAVIDLPNGEKEVTFWGPNNPARWFFHYYESHD